MENNDDKPDDDPLVFGQGRTLNRLQMFRTQLGKTRREMAQLVRMSVDYYCKVERGERIPGSQYVGHFERAFKQAFRYLYPAFFEPEFLERGLPTIMKSEKKKGRSVVSTKPQLQDNLKPSHIFIDTFSITERNMEKYPLTEDELEDE